MAAAQTLPLDYELIVYSGTNYHREFRWLPDGVTPADLTGWSAVMPIGPINGDPTLLLSTFDASITVSLIGQIIIDMTPAQTATLTPGVTHYNIDLTDLTGYVRRFMRGRISVVQDVKTP